ncbi:TetR family transcriptional regulator [Paenibacillus sp. LMG 31456]|uniref:TetR family transcriptional regulator n=1 Tax=Paenibacillus foliorum TaxID=2654974 RepID=A0A972JZR7_9BACL|nr:TetR/AcrR family transcriptional regulator [Paenibacillus foliorum]NOU93876.1 TetR family transcriptional regulator [Paenibacillus foliorum]
MTAAAIKAAALNHFARNGYEGTPLSDIAKEVGIKTPSLYAHFRSKEELFMKLFEDVLLEQSCRTQQLIDSLNNYSVEQTLFRILQDSCDNYLLSEEKITFIKRVMLFPPAFLQEQIHRKFLETESTLTDSLQKIFTEGIRKGTIKEEPIEDLVASYLCLMDGSFLQLFYYGKEYFESRLQSIWRIYWDGITAVATASVTRPSHS